MRVRVGSITIDEVFLLSAVIFIGLMAFVVAMVVWGGGIDILNDFCATYPEWCGGTASSEEHELAMSSADALACGIKFVATGEVPVECGEYFSTTSSTTSQSGNVIGFEGLSFTGGFGWEYNNFISRLQDSQPSQASQEAAESLSLDPGFGSEYRDFITGLEVDDFSIPEPKLKCEYSSSQGDADNVVIKLDMELEGITDEQCRGKCNANVYFNCEITNDNGKKWCSFERVKGIKYCTITDFHLPQSFPESIVPKDLIEPLGDPWYILFYQNFPQGEDDSWNVWSAWMSQSRVLLYGTACATGLVIGVVSTYYSAVKASKEGTKELVGGGVERVISYIKNRFTKDAGKETSEEIGDRFSTGVVTDFTGDYVDDFVEEYVEHFRILGSGGYVAPEVTSEVTSEVTESAVSGFFRRIVWTSLKEKFLSIPGSTVAWGSAKVLGKTAGYTALTTAGAWTLSEYIDRRMATELGKFDPRKGRLILQQALEPEPVLNEDVYSVRKSRSSLDIGRPILLRKGGIELFGSELLEKLTPFYLASPCHADLMLTKEIVECEKYSYYGDTKSVFCDNPETTDFDITSPIDELGNVVYERLHGEKLCGDVPKGIKTLYFNDAWHEIDNVVYSSGNKEVKIETSNDFDTNYFSIKDPMHGYTFIAQYTPMEDEPNGGMVCCQLSSNSDKHKWAFNLCHGGFDPVEDETKCMEWGEREGLLEIIFKGSQRPDLRVGYPLRVISVTDSDGNSVPFTSGYYCVIRDSMMTELNGVDVSDIDFDYGLLETEMFGGGRYVVCEIPSRAWSAGIGNPNNMMLTYGYYEHEPNMADPEYSNTHDGIIYLMGVVDYDFEFNDPEHPSNDELEELERVGREGETAFKGFAGMGVFRTDSVKTGTTDPSLRDSVVISYVDSNMDGIADSLMKSLEPGNPTGSFRFIDTDYDKKFDSIIQDECNVEAIIITPFMGGEKYEDYEYNFCYSEGRKFKVVTATAVGIFSDIILKKVVSKLGGGLGMGVSLILGAVVDCGLAMWETKDTTDWPENDNKKVLPTEDSSAWGIYLIPILVSSIF